MKIENNSIDFDHVKRSVTSINDVERTVKVNNFSFKNVNFKGDFISINSVEDLKKLHKKGSNIANKLLKIIE